MAGDRADDTRSRGRRPKAPVDAPAQREGVLGLLGDEAVTLAKVFGSAIRDAPNQRVEGRKEAASRFADVPWYRPDVRLGRTAADTGAGRGQ
ncbi:MAG TPA: hypothetical protein VKQ27_09245 [Acetobacteraceae bacterium]|nr:hypothetical protein [Acetobacteraceae bacterium]